MCSGVDSLDNIVHTICPGIIYHENCGTHPRKPRRNLAYEPWDEFHGLYKPGGKLSGVSTTTNASPYHAAHSDIL